MVKISSSSSSCGVCFPVVDRMIPFLSLLLILSLLGGGKAGSGVDLSVETSGKDWKCLVEEYNVTFAIIRSYRSVGEVDHNGPSSIKHAGDSGLADIGAYVFPCIPSASYSIANNITCISPEAQVDETMLFLRKSGITVGKTGKYSINRVWIDVEDEIPSKYYDSDPAVNQAFLKEMVGRLEELQVPVGIYTTSTYWQNIMDNVKGYSEYPLWYPRYDGDFSMDFYEPFGGWNEVNIKQLAGNSGFCSISQVDTDYRED